MKYPNAKFVHTVLTTDAASAAADVVLDKEIESQSGTKLWREGERV